MDLNDKVKFNILIVDDNPKNIQVIGNILKETDYIVGFAMDGQQALNQLQNTNDYDLVLLDIEMPVMDGYETCIAMRKDNKLKDIPVIFLTAFSDVTNIVKGFEAGAQDYITKPFNSQELLVRVSTHLQLKYKSDIIRNLNVVLEQKVSERTSELQKALSELNNIDGMKTDFLIFISQEIRNPLSGIVGTLGLIKNQDHSSTIRNLLETLESSVTKLEEYTYKALLFNQIFQKEYKPQINDLSLKDLIQYVILEHSELIRGKNINIQSDDLDRNIFIKGDRDLLFKAFCYVFQNALKYSHKNDTVFLKFIISDEKIFSSIIDHGEGFPLEVIKHLEVSFNYNGGHNFQQTGLSLYIVKQIMDLHIGTMRLSNNENGGACVQLILNR